MDKFYQIVLVFYLFFIVFVITDISDDSVKLHRPRRYLSFRNISRFFVRLNFKANMVAWNQIFAQALGYRMNWDEPPDSFRPYHHLNRRDVYETMELLLNKNGLNGFHCVRRIICEVNQMDDPIGTYNKILKIIFRQQSSATDKWHSVEDECSISINSCPFSLLEILPYTDL